jgi:hypothetical protein
VDEPGCTGHGTSLLGVFGTGAFAQILPLNQEMDKYNKKAPMASAFFNAGRGTGYHWISKTGTVSQSAIRGQGVNLILRQLAKAAGIPNSDQMSAHSLRRGFATEPARLGASMPSSSPTAVGDRPSRGYRSRTGAALVSMAAGHMHNGVNGASSLQPHTTLSVPGTGTQSPSLGACGFGRTSSHL